MKFLTETQIETLPISVLQDMVFKIWNQYHDDANCVVQRITDGRQFVGNYFTDSGEKHPYKIANDFGLWLSHQPKSEVTRKQLSELHESIREIYTQDKDFAQWIYDMETGAPFVRHYVKHYCDDESYKYIWAPRLHMTGEIPNVYYDGSWVFKWSRLIINSELGFGKNPEKLKNMDSDLRGAINTTSRAYTAGATCVAIGDVNDFSTKTMCYMVKKEVVSQLIEELKEMGQEVVRKGEFLTWKSLLDEFQN